MHDLQRQSKLCLHSAYTAHLRASVLLHVITTPPTDQYPSEEVVTLVILVRAVGVLGVVSILEPSGKKPPP